MVGHRVNRIHVRKESLKFSAGHMTVFPDGTKEALHGHNYQTELVVELRQTALKDMVSFSVFKDALREVCTEWDEKVLLARNCPFLERISENGLETEFRLCAKRYVLPTEDIAWLPVENISAEELAAEALRRVMDKVQPGGIENVLSLELRIEESPGQGASLLWRRSLS